MEVSVRELKNDELEVKVGCKEGIISKETAAKLAQALASPVKHPGNYIWLYSNAPSAPGWYGPYDSVVVSNKRNRQVDAEYAKIHPAFGSGLEGGLEGPVIGISISATKPIVGM